MSRKEQLLKKYFGHEEFRGAQETVIDAILAGRDVVAIMPTGAGKSICYQLPALMLEGVTLVISPLISLMKDQVAALIQSGIPAAYLNSSLTQRQHAEVLRRAHLGAYRILYVAPERLLTEGFLAFSQSVPIAMVTVDEAHCISQWGQDFRPSYLKITDFVNQLPKRPILSAFTATATDRVRRDIIRALSLRDPSVTVTGFDRKNLYFQVQQPDSKDAALLQFLREHQGESGIVYCITRKGVEQVCTMLVAHGYNAARYHAGLDPEERQRSQDDFLFDRKTIMVATNAFGMGIDKSNVTFVVHYNMPRDIESYYQEAGRAGRDGSPSDCLLLFSPADVRMNRFLIERSGENPDLSPRDRALLKSHDLERLQQMTAYCQSETCLRVNLLNYFGEKMLQPCGNCSVCLPEYTEEDVTVDCQKLLSCIHRIMRQGYKPGRELVYDILQGKRGHIVDTLKLDTLTTFGILPDTKRERLEELTRLLCDCGYVTQRGDVVPMLYPKEGGNAVLRGKRRMTLKHPVAPPAAASRRSTDNSALFNALKELRAQLSKKESIPAFVIFTDATLRDMCLKLPANEREFRRVSGVSDAKAEKYGKLFLQVIQKHRA